MSGKRFAPEQNLGILLKAEVKVSNGRSVKYIYRQLSMTEQTYYSWCREYRGIKVVQTRRLRDLEKETRGSRSQWGIGQVQRSQQSS